MSNTISARVTMSGLDTRFKYVIAALEEGLAQTVSDASIPITQAAQAMAPVETGELRDSITSELTESTSTRATVRIAPHTNYAAYVEFGTGKRGSESAGAGPGPYNENWAGMAAQPYMRPALDEQGPAAVQQMKDEVKQNIIEALQGAR